MNLQAIDVGAVIDLVSFVAYAISITVAGRKRVRAVNRLTILVVGVELVSWVAVAIALRISSCVSIGACHLDTKFAESWIDLEASLTDTLTSFWVSLRVRIIAVRFSAGVVACFISSEAWDASAHSLLVSDRIILRTLDELAQFPRFVARVLSLADAGSKFISEGIRVCTRSRRAWSWALKDLESSDALTLSTFLSRSVGIGALDDLTLRRVLVNLVSVNTDTVSVVVPCSLRIVTKSLLTKLRVRVELVVGDAATFSSGEISDSVGVSALSVLTKLELLVHVKADLALAFAVLKVSDPVRVLAGQVSAGGVVIHEIAESWLAVAFTVEELSSLLAFFAHRVGAICAVLRA